MKSIIFCIIQLFFISSVLAQSELQFANLGDFETEQGAIIRDCKIGYRTVGKLNANKSNAILWPTWFGGTTSNIIDFGVLGNLADTTQHYIILVDALSNGISSSPSNSVDYPEAISIQDMVNSQHQLLKNVFEINHLKAVMGISMGALQTYKWIVTYPNFMDKAIVIAGTPELSFYDILFLKTQKELVEEAGMDEKRLQIAMKRITDIGQLHLYTSDYLSRTQRPENVDKYLTAQYNGMANPRDFLSQMNAVLGYGIYGEKDQVEVQKKIKVPVFIVQNKSDLTLNYLNSAEFAKTTNSRILLLESDCGHLFFDCEHGLIRDGIQDFLRMN